MADQRITPPARFYGYAVIMMLIGPLIAAGLGLWALDSLGDAVAKAQWDPTPAAKEIDLAAGKSFELIVTGPKNSIDRVSVWMIDANGRGVGLHTGAESLHVSSTIESGAAFKLVGFVTDLPAGHYTLGAVGPSGTNVTLVETPRNVAYKIIGAKVAIPLTIFVGLVFALLVYFQRRRSRRDLFRAQANAPPPQSYGVGAGHQKFKMGLPNDPFEDPDSLAHTPEPTSEPTAVHDTAAADLATAKLVAAGAVTAAPGGASAPGGLPSMLEVPRMIPPAAPTAPAPVASAPPPAAFSAPPPPPPAAAPAPATTPAAPATPAAAPPATDREATEADSPFAPPTTPYVAPAPPPPAPPP